MENKRKSVKKESNLKEREREILKKLFFTHEIENLDYEAKLINASNNYILILSNNLLPDEYLWILHYLMVYFSKNQKDTVVTFDLKNQNKSIHKRVYNLLCNKKFKSEKILKLIGDLNEKF